jgi:hypothetical protein
MAIIIPIEINPIFKLVDIITPYIFLISVSLFSERDGLVLTYRILSSVSLLPHGHVRTYALRSASLVPNTSPVYSRLSAKVDVIGRTTNHSPLSNGLSRE